MIYQEFYLLIEKGMYGFGKRYCVPTFLPYL